jgi:hypothetical protein
MGKTSTRSTNGELAPRMDAALPPWMAALRAAAQKYIQPADIEEIVRNQVTAAKGGDKAAMKFVFEQVLGGAALKGATFVQNVYEAGSVTQVAPRALPRPTRAVGTAAPAAPGPVETDDDPGGDDDDDDEDAADDASDPPPVPQAGRHVPVLAIPPTCKLPNDRGGAIGGICRVCGCTDDHACQCADGQPCGWTNGATDLCTACAERAEALLASPPGKPGVVEKAIRATIAAEDSANVVALALSCIAGNQTGMGWRRTMLERRAAQLAGGRAPA